MNTSSISRWVWVIRCRLSGLREPGSPGERDVDAVALETLLELGRRELLGALLDRGFERLARLVRGLAGGGALGGGKLGDVAQQVRQLGLAAQVLDADVLEAVRVGSGGDRLLGLGSNLRDPVGHSGAILRLSS